MSPSPEHPSADTLHERAGDELPAHALGAPLPPELADHVRTCVRCQDDLGAYRSIAGLARAERPSSVPDSATPAPHVWDRIAAELGLSKTPGTAGTSVTPGTPTPAATPASPGAPAPTPLRRRRVSARRVVTGLLVAAAVVAAGLSGWAIGQHGNRPGTTAQAALAAQPGTAASAHGRATMRSSADGFQMQLTTTGLPAPSGYYEVWLFDPSANRMVAIGTLGADARGTFTVPAGIDTHAYHVVDVSNQRYNGNPAHETSVLRGSLTTS